MGFAFEHRGREPERVFRNDRYAEHMRGPVHEDPRVTEERERALMRAAFAASRLLDPQDATRPALAEKLNGPRAAGLVLQRSPIQEQEPETIQRQTSGHTEGDCWEAYTLCVRRCSEISNRREKEACRSQCMNFFAACRATADGRKILDSSMIGTLLLLAVAFGLAVADGPVPAGEALVALILADLYERQKSGRLPAQ